MAQVLALTAPRTLAFVDLPDPPLAPTQVRVRTLYSGISAGTEMTQYRGTNPYLHKVWDGAARLFLPAAEPSQPWPLLNWGYEEVGEVTQVGDAVTDLIIGDVVYGTWGHRTHAVLEDAYAAQRRKPAALDPLLTIFSHLGPIALTGILDAQIHIGETVAVFGLGVVGQVVAQLAKASGAQVVGVELAPQRLALAQELGAIHVALNPRDCSPAEMIKKMTQGRGADVSIECTGAAAALHEAVRATAYNARVVALGFVQGGAGALFLGEEFHHNRIQIICSQIGNVDPALHQRWERLRLIHTIMDLQVRGTLNLRPLITHLIPFAQAGSAFALLDSGAPDVLQTVLTFEAAGEAR
jgi:2-desacetyl-2-hydroxyethyl bacteriochlorophyllide A dehydrogenase